MNWLRNLKQFQAVTINFDHRRYCCALQRSNLWRQNWSQPPWGQPLDIDHRPYRILSIDLNGSVLHQSQVYATLYIMYHTRWRLSFIDLVGIAQVCTSLTRSPVTSTNFFTNTLAKKILISTLGRITAQRIGNTLVLLQESTLKRSENKSDMFALSSYSWPAKPGDFHFVQSIRASWILTEVIFLSKCSVSTVDRHSKLLR